MKKKKRALSYNKMNALLAALNTLAQERVTTSRSYGFLNKVALAIEEIHPQFMARHKLLVSTLQEQYPEKYKQPPEPLDHEREVSFAQLQQELTEEEVEFYCRHKFEEEDFTKADISMSAQTLMGLAPILKSE